jgi:hypothetical protein
MMKNEAYGKLTLSVNYPVMDAGQLRELLSLVMRPHYAELDLTGPKGMLFISKTGDRAFLMFLRYDGDAGFHSVNPEYVGPADAMLELYMKNGQSDEKPLAEWISVDEAQRVAEHFFQYGERAPWITWHDDSQ